MGESRAGVTSEYYFNGSKVILIEVMEGEGEMEKGGIEREKERGERETETHRNSG